MLKKDNKLGALLQSINSSINRASGGGNCLAAQQAEVKSTAFGAEIAAVEISTFCSIFALKMPKKAVLFALRLL